MTDYTFWFQGREGERKTVQCDTIDHARNEAVRYLGSFLATHPKFADEGHWRINVDDSNGDSLLHVIVATVTADASRRRTD